MPFKYVKGPTSDVTFEASGANLEEVFESSARALLGVMYEMEDVKAERREVLELEGSDYEDLLHLFLSQLIVALEIENLFPAKIELKFDGNRLKAVLLGQDVEVEKLHTIVKGVTYHDFYLKQTPTGWKAKVVLDI